MDEVLKFAVGDGLSHSYWTDFRPFTVVKVSASGKTVWAREDECVLIENRATFTPGGFVGHWDGLEKNVYDFIQRDEGPLTRFSLRKDGHWHRAGCKGDYVVAGRRYYIDWNR